MGQMTQPSVIALKNDGQSTTSRANPTRFSSLKGKEKDVSKKLLIHTYSTMKTEDTEALGRYRAKSSRTKPDRVDRPVRTPRTFVHHQNSTQYCNTETVFFSIFPFLQTNIPSQMWPSGGKGKHTFKMVQYRVVGFNMLPDIIYKLLKQRLKTLLFGSQLTMAHCDFLLTVGHFISWLIGSLFMRPKFNMSPFQSQTIDPKL